MSPGGGSRDQNPRNAKTMRELTEAERRFQEEGGQAAQDEAAAAVQKALQDRAAGGDRS